MTVNDLIRWMTQNCQGHEIVRFESGGIEGGMEEVNDEFLTLANEQIDVRDDKKYDVLNIQ